MRVRTGMPPVEGNHDVPGSPTVKEDRFGSGAGKILRRYRKGLEGPDPGRDDCP